MSNPISVVGTIATEPKRIVTQSGVTLCTFRVASGDRRYDREQQKWVDGETNWFGVTAFRTLAEHAIESFKKGERVIVSGRLRIRKWENEEKSGISVEIEADAIGHDVRWGVSNFKKRTPAGSDSASTPQGEDDESDAVSDAPEGSRERGDGFIPVAA